MCPTQHAVQKGGVPLANAGPWETKGGGSSKWDHGRSEGRKGGHHINPFRGTQRLEKKPKSRSGKSHLKGIVRGKEGNPVDLRWKRKLGVSVGIPGDTGHRGGLLWPVRRRRCEEITMRVPRREKNEEPVGKRRAGSNRERRIFENNAISLEKKKKPTEHREKKTDVEVDDAAL